MSTVAEYLTEQIEKSGLLQKEIADQMGNIKPNAITMFKQGNTRIPYERVGGLADVLLIDRFDLLMRCMAEYHPQAAVIIGNEIARIR